jgi:adenylate cyclase, class 2
MPQAKKTNAEIEIKLRVTDPRAIQRRIIAIGATPQPRILEKNILYDTAHSDLRRRGMLLRIRIETPGSSDKRSPRPERVILTSKAPPQTKPAKKPSRYKERAERELVVVSQSSREYAAAITSLGFRPAFRYDKYRTTFRLPNLHLDLDETSAGTFLELEGKAQAIDRAAKALGFSKKAYLRATYWDLYVADCRRRGTIPKNMLFRAK